MNMTARPLVFTLALLLSASTAFPMSRRPSGPALLLVPERYSVMQVGFDVLARRSAILVSYRGELEAPELHAWSGREWVAVDLAAFKDGSFLRVVPRQAILVGDEETLPPVLTESVRSWCRTVWVAESAATADLVNSLGQVLSFSDEDWQWFSARYNLELTDINAERRKNSWYYHPFVDDRGGLPVPVEEEIEAAPAASADAAEPTKPRLSLPAPAAEESVSAEPMDDENLK